MTEVYIEVTNTLEVPFLSGLQRVTRELLAHLPATGDTRFTPVRWCPTVRGFRRLTARERARLADPVRLGRRRRWVRRLAGLWRNFNWSQHQLQALRIDRPWTPGSVWFDVEAAWHDPVPRRELLVELSAADVRIATLVADVLPERHPEWFVPRSVERFRSHLRAHLRHASAFVCISEFTRSELLDLAAELVPERELSTSVVTLGANFSGRIGDVPAALAGRRTLLVVGTIEPRKHHDLAIDVFDRLRSRHPDLALVIAGRDGWGADVVVERIREHPELDRSLHWWNDLDDDALATLYATSFLHLVPSWAEGFGAPVVEALALGLPTISSTGGALPEAGGDLAEYVDPDDTEGWIALVGRHLDDAAHHESVRSRLRGWSPTTWAGTAAAVTAALAPVLD